MPKPVQMTRVVRFSSGHRYWLEQLSEDDNRALFGKWASKFNHGHNYVLSVTVSGPVDPRTGMIVNIKIIDAILKESIVCIFDQKSINDEISFFKSHAACLENIVCFIKEQIPVLPQGVQLTKIKLEEAPDLWAELDLTEKPSPMLTLTRTYEFAASHRLHGTELSPAENLELYGKCNNPFGHGHNYLLEVTVTGEPDSRTGMIADITELDRVVHKEVVDRYDHKNLNEDIPEFKDQITTSENVASVIWERLENAVPGNLSRIRLHETARNIFEVSR